MQRFREVAEVKRKRVQAQWEADKEAAGTHCSSFGIDEQSNYAQITVDFVRADVSQACTEFLACLQIAWGGSRRMRWSEMT